MATIRLGEYKITIEGRDQEHQVRDLRIENMSILGRLLTGNSASLKIGQYVTGFSVIPQDIR